jgi:hypothetical protein
MVSNWQNLFYCDSDVTNWNSDISMTLDIIISIEIYYFSEIPKLVMKNLIQKCDDREILRHFTVVPIEAFRKMLTNSFPNLKEHLWTIPQQFEKFLKSS